MKRLVLAAAGAAVAGLTACSHSATPAAAPASPPASSTATAGPASTASPSASAAGPSRHAATGAPTAAMAATCKQRYDAWQQGPGNGLVAALNAVGAAETAGNAQALTAALKQAAPAVAKAARNPLPSCADPKGYWEVLLMHVNAAVAGKSSAAGVQAAMKDVPGIEHALTTELKASSR